MRGTLQKGLITADLYPSSCPMLFVQVRSATAAEDDRPHAAICERVAQCAGQRRPAVHFVRC